MIHELKCEIPYFEDVLNGIKTFEVRKNDRNYKVNDILNLREFIPVTKSIYYNVLFTADDPRQPQAEFTGREFKVKVIYILRGNQYGIHHNYVVLGIIPVKN